MFITICILVIVALIISHRVRNFWEVSVDAYYKTKGGKVVYIREKKRVGIFDIYVSEKGEQYFKDGRLVGDLFKDSPTRLIKKY